MGGSTHCGFIVTNRSFYPEKHILTGVTTVAGENNLQNLTFGYDDFNNLEARIDNLRNLNESFTYDNLNRLTDIELNGVQTGRMTYDDYGRMTSKTMDGQLVFQGASFDGPEGKPHAIKSAQTNEGVFPADVQKITYTSFDKVKHIAEGDNRLSYTYGYNRQRIGMEETVGGKQRSKVYVGNCEYVTETADGVTTEKVLTYLSGPTGVFAVVEKQDDNETLHYILKDHLGSWTTITDAEGNVEQELSYDAWGTLRDPETWTGASSETPMFDRGFTGHEHLRFFDLINMNGRMYDPVMSSFLSVDAYVQDPTSAQGFNRYAYCSHNPLRYVDPTGWSNQPFGNPNVAPPCNPIKHTTYSSNDPIDMLWGYGSFSCSSSSGSCNGNDVTTTMVRQGNEQIGNWYKDVDGTMIFDKNLLNQSQLKDGQEFCGTSFIQNDLFYSMFGDVYKVNSISGKIVMKLELEVWPNWTNYTHQMEDFNCAWSNGEIGQGSQEPQQATTDFSEIVEYKENGNNCYSFKYGDAKVYFYVLRENAAMITNFRGWDDTDYSRNSDKTGRHETSGYDVHIRSWGNDHIKNPPHNGGYQGDVIKFVYPTYDSRKYAGKRIYNKYY